MKTIFDAFTWRLIRSNLIYITSCIFFVAITIFFVPIKLQGLMKTRQREVQLKTELDTLESRKRTIYSFKPDEIDRLAATLNSLLPAAEDYFSIFDSLQRLSQQTGFLVTGYAIKPMADRKDVTLDISGTGSPDAIISFIKNYHFTGGRLITISELVFSPQSSETTFTLHFHTLAVNQVKAVSDVQVDKKTFELVGKIADELGAKSSQTQPESVDETDYSRATNPFGQ